MTPSEPVGVPRVELDHDRGQFDGQPRGHPCPVPAARFRGKPGTAHLRHCVTLSARHVAWSSGGGDLEALIVTGWSPAELAILRAPRRQVSWQPGSRSSRRRAWRATPRQRSRWPASTGSRVRRCRSTLVTGSSTAWRTSFSTAGPVVVDRTGRSALTLTRPLLHHPPSTVVTGIHPTATTIPLNTLRVYVRFSAPMSEGFAAAAVRLRDVASGTVLEHSFLPTEPELWDPNRRRLTLLLDPGRIKRGLVPHADEGYPLTPGRSVELVVDRGFKDAAGRALLTDAVREYQVGQAARGRLDPSRWVLQGPRVGTTEPLRVRADRPLDHALAQRCLTVVDDAGRALPGRGLLETGDRDWSFTPDTAWTTAPHALLVDPRLEDVAGNSVRRVFDRDLDLPDHDPTPGGTVVIRLTSRA